MSLQELTSPECWSLNVSLQKQHAKLFPEFKTKVVSEHATFDSFQQVLGHTSILWISRSKLWHYNITSAAPKLIQCLSACHKLFGPDTFCELHTNTGHSTELETMLHSLAFPSFVSTRMYTFLFGHHKSRYPAFTKPARPKEATQYSNIKICTYMWK